MNSNLSITYLPPLGSKSTCILLPAPILSSQNNKKKNFAIKASAASSTNPPNPFLPHLKAAACAVVFCAVTFCKCPGPAWARRPETLTVTICHDDAIEEEEDSAENSLLTHLFDLELEEEDTAENSLLTQLLESSPAALELLLQEKLEDGPYSEILSILQKLSAVQPENEEWMLMMSRLLSEMGRVEEARKALEEILSRNPVSFEALLENAVLMDVLGESEEVMPRLKEALSVAESGKEARDVMLIMSHMQFIAQIKEMLLTYEKLAPSDFRLYLCKGMIYSLMDKKELADQQFNKYKQLSPNKYHQLKGYLRTPLLGMALLGTDHF